MTIEVGTPTIQTYYIVFDKQRSPIRRWWRLFTGKTFAHCYIMTDGPANTTIKIEPLLAGVDFQVIELPIEQSVQAMAVGGVTAIVSYTVNSTNLVDHVPRGIISCVSLVKAFLYLRKSGLTLTPFQLYKLLLRRGAIPIKPYAPYVDNN